MEARRNECVDGGSGLADETENCVVSAELQQAMKQSVQLLYESAPNKAQLAASWAAVQLGEVFITSEAGSERVSTLI